MDVAWQDSVGSFLDSAGTDASSFASFVNDDGGTLWSSSGDSPLFSSQPVLWESGADSPGDSRISALTADSANPTDTGTLLASGWLADGTFRLASGSSALDSGLLWAGAGSDTSSSLSTSGGTDGLGSLGSLDLGAAGSASSQWQQFVDQFAGGSAMGLSDTPHLLWTGGSSQPSLTVPTSAGSQPVHVDPNNSGQAPIAVPAPSSSLPVHIDPNDSLGLAPSQLVWTQPSAATGLAAGPILADATPSRLSSGVVVPSELPSGVPINARL